MFHVSSPRKSAANTLTQPLHRRKPATVRNADRFRPQFQPLEDRTTPTLCCGDFLTYTQGGWGAEPAGNNPGTYLHANFGSAFSGGVQIGSQAAGAASDSNTSAGNQAALFTSAQAITDWLPHGGKSGSLGGDSVNPLLPSAPDDGTLAGQTLALTLNLGFDGYDPAFSPSSSDMGSLIVTSGPFAGKTADFVLATANAILSGDTTTGYTADQANEAATAINQNFDNGSANGGTDLGYLDCAEDDCDNRIMAAVEITGRKFEDVNGDGDDEGGTDPGLAGVSIDMTFGPDAFTILSGNTYLYDAETDTLSDTGDLLDGEYVVSVINIDVTDGNVLYTIQEAPLAGWTQTFGNAGYGGAIHADPNPVSENNDFGNFENVTLSGVKFEDHNGNGVRDVGDQGLENWTINVGSGTATTDANGDWSITVGPGTFAIQEVLQMGWTQTFGNAGYSVTTSSGTDVGGNDFGNFENITIRGVKFYDADTDGVQDIGEPAISGWQVGLDTTGDSQADVFILTDATGAYAFANLGPGMYAVIEGTQANWVATTAVSVSVTAGGTGVQSGGTATADFGNVKLGTTGGKTIGFWSNKNGQNTMTNSTGGMSGALNGLTALNLRTATGGDFDPSNYAAYRTWLLNATATNMAHMLSAQLSGAWLNVNVLGVSGDTMIHVGTLSAWTGNGQGAALLTNLGTLVSSTGFVKLSDVMTAANTLLGTNGSIPAGDPLRAYAEALKIVLDGFNNNLSIAVIGLAFGWDTNDNGVLDSGELGFWTW